ncbi:MAG: cytochrome b [Rickettsiales bacterium]
MQSYSKQMKIIHWIVGALYIGLLTVGLYMTSLTKEDPTKAELYALHKSFGVVALLFIIWRLVVRLKSLIPAPSEKIPAWEKMLASLGHFALYVLMIAMAFSGYLMSSLGGKGIVFFGYKLPNFLAQNKDLAGDMHSIHTFLPWFFVAVIAAHILSWPYHYLKQKINIIRRII